MFTIREEDSYKILYVAVGGAGVKVMEKLHKQMPNIKSVWIDRECSQTPVAGVTKLKIDDGTLSVQSETDLINNLNDADMVLMVMGLGGETGSNLCSQIAEVFMKRNIFTVTIATDPFGFEGQNRAHVAHAGLKALTNADVPVVLLKNDIILPHKEKGLLISGAFTVVDDFVLRAMQGVTGMICSSGDYDINIDLEEMKYMFEGQKALSVGFGAYERNDTVSSALLRALEFPLPDSGDTKNASRVMVHFSIHPDTSFVEVGEAMEIFENRVGDSIDVLFASSTNEVFSRDRTEVTLIWNRFKFREEHVAPANNVDYRRR